jgi:hypothetical protein
VMIGEFFAGLDVRAELPALGDLVESWRPDAIVRESWEFGSELLAERHGIPILRVGLGLAGIEAETMKIAAPAMDKARAELGLASDPAGKRLAATPYMTMMPAELEDPATPTPLQVRRFRFEVNPRAEELPDWWPGNQDPLVYLTFGSVAAGAHLPYYPALYRARPSRPWHRSRSGFCSLSATQSGKSRNSGRCPPTSTLRHGYRTTTSRDAPM